MHIGPSAHLATGVLLAAAGAWGAAAFHTAPTARDVPQCTITFNTAIPVQRDSVDVSAAYTDAIGDSLKATFAPGARIAVSRVQRDRNTMPYGALITVNTADAVPGEWDVTLTGDAGECMGKATVEQPKR